MERIIWVPEFETGIEIIDDQHNRLFRTMDNFAIAIYGGEGKTKLRQLLIFLDEYIHDHFNTEEKLLSLNNYPEYDEHIKKHKQFTSMFNDYREDFNQRGSDTYLAKRLEKEIRNWWENHILNIDMKYAPQIEILSEK